METAAVDWRREWRLSGWQVELMVETWRMASGAERLGTGDDNGNTAAGDWRQQWILCSCGLERTMET